MGSKPVLTEGDRKRFLRPSQLPKGKKKGHGPFQLKGRKRPKK